MLHTLTAIRFSKVMGSGRTQPCLMVCEDESGGEVEVVVKLRKHPQILPGGFVAEAMASFLALDLGLDRLQGALEALDENRFRAYVEAVPAEWNGEAITGVRIAEYLLTCIPHFNRIKLQLQTVL